MKVSELTGVQLDYWVARAEGKIVVKIVGDTCFTEPLISDYPSVFQPSTNWAQGGPIIDSSDGNGRIFQLEHCSNDPGLSWMATLDDEGGTYWGSTLLEAAMRAYVASKFGDEVPGDPLNPSPSA